MTTILVLGAGASQPASYPTAEELLPRIKLEASSSCSVQFRKAWIHWKEFLRTLPPALEVVRSCANPEIILSFVDLLAAAAESEDEFRTRRALKRFVETGESAHEELEAYFASEGRDLLSQARTAQARLLECLDWFFGLRHAEDRRKPGAARDYLRKIFAGLAKGDAIITFNWDTLAERTLAEDGRWSPAEGYSFPRRLSQNRGYGQFLPIPEGQLKPSDVVVLKLHGSYGWHRLNNTFFLDSANYLAGFTLYLGSQLVLLRDDAEPASYLPSDLVLAYPSFLKPLADPVLEEVWMEAVNYLRRAALVEIIGYSLPSSDAAARVLFAPLARRLRAGEVRVVVRDPSRQTLSRWKTFLGSKAELREESLQQSGCSA